MRQRREDEVFSYDPQMAQDTELQLLDTLTRPVEPGEAWHLRLGAVESLIASLVGGDRQVAPEPSMRRPDVTVRRVGQPPVVIEVKATRRSDVANGVRAMTSSLLSSAVELRRSFREEVILAAMIVPVAGDPDSRGDASSGPNAAARLEREVQRLLRGQDGVGFDLVLVAAIDAGITWHRFTRSALGALDTSIDSTAAMVSDLLAQHAPAPQPPVAASSSHPLRVLLVADEWKSGRGGISTINRELAVALASAGGDIAVMVPTAHDEDVQAAADRGVSLVQPAAVPGLSERELLLLRPVFADGSWTPDVVIGHGRLLGPYAYALQQEHFPQARRVHVVHTAAEQLEAAKETLDGESRMVPAEERSALERRLAQSADLVVGIGPLLTDAIKDELLATGANTPVICILPGLAADHVVDPSRIPAASTVLLLGRADDFRSKGVDIVAQALLEVVDRWPVGEPDKPAIALRGVPPEQANSVKHQLTEIVGDRVKCYLRPYSESVDDLTVDMAKARVVVMPSRHEGFGLAALEAIAMGVPVLVSQQSGLARFLNAHSIDTYPSSIVSTENTASQLAVDRWADAIEQALRNPIDARSNAAKLRSEVDNAVTWDKTGAQMLATLETLQ